VSRIAEASLLHPAMQDRVLDLDARIEQAGIPLRTYETVRSPWRQAELYARGRAAGSVHKKVTKAKAWQSRHQFGMAVDKVFYLSGKGWTWEEPEAGMWAAYHELARGVNLWPLGFEKPHVELMWNAESLARGQLPAGWNDSAFGDLFTEWCEKWGSHPRTESWLLHPGAPPLAGLDERPPLDDEPAA
jgi:peptidoglycan L-alanyl-D-glutamate endopeptidase CwlK